MLSRSRSFFFLFIQIIVICPLISTTHLRNTLPSIRVIEIRSTFPTKLETENVIDKPPNSNIVIGEDVDKTSKLVFDCQAPYSVQWVYFGDGMPEYSTNTTQITHQEGLTRPGNLSTASLSIGFNKPIGSQDSGKYVCRSTYNSKSEDQSSYYYLYVAGDESKLFTNPGGETIYYKSSDASVRIPCSVSNPNAAVSLQKSINGLVQCPLNQSITYDATKGFELKVSEYFEPQGVYVCTAGLSNGTFQVVKYTLLKDVEASPVQKDSCFKNSDCTQNLACISTDGRYSCVSPCGAVCGQNTNCEVTRHIPKCFCKTGFSGDPYQACIESPMKVENDPCRPNPCGQNTICERLGNVARCACASGGFVGDPYVRCYKPVTRNPCDPNPCGPNSICRYNGGYTSCSCRPGFYGTPPYCRAECEMNRDCTSDRACVYGRCRNPCEGACRGYPNTECRVIRQQAVCATINCQPGYFGRDCLSVYTKEEGRVKLPQHIQPDMELSETVSPCVPFPCGKHAECVVKSMENTALNITTDIALCHCPAKFTGNADMECYPIEEQFSRNEQISATPESSDIQTTTKTNIDFTCTPECGLNAACEDSRCACKKSYQGNPHIKCYPIYCSNSTECDYPGASCVEGKCFEESSGSDDIGKHCGVNAISIVLEDGNSTCICPQGYTGIANIACHMINLDQRNDTNHIVDIINASHNNQNCTNTENICGKNTNCTIDRKSNATNCECVKLFEGNPWIGCERQCNSNDDCPTQYICHDQSHRCVDPCDKEYQSFFTQCGRDSLCTVDDHVPSCHCPQNLPYGNPHIHCKEKEWMPNHRVGNSTCQDEKRLNCGPNSSCKRFHDSTEYCTCLPGFFGDPNDGKGCKLGLQCRKNNQCRHEEECVNGRCLNACRSSKCGPFSGCKPDNHKPNCICHIGTVFNPKKGECEAAKGALAERLLFFRSFEDV